MVTGYLRNSQHNNGIHRGPDLSITFLDMKYDLKKDVAVNCSSWQHIFVALTETVRIIDEILQATAIQTLAAPIPDAYALNSVD